MPANLPSDQTHFIRTSAVCPSLLVRRAKTKNPQFYMDGESEGKSESPRHSEESVGRHRDAIADIILPVVSARCQSKAADFLPPSSIPRVSQFPQIPISGTCKAELLPAFFPKIVVREARREDYWEMAEIICSSFHPGCSFPLDFVRKLKTLVKKLTISPPPDSRLSHLVAVVGSSVDDRFLIGTMNFRIRDGIRLNRRFIAGVLMVESFVYFLPRKGSSQQRRIIVAYISDVAVRERYRRKGIAKMLIAKAEAKARSWGCHAMALHYDMDNHGATMLYEGLGFTCIEEPEGTYWYWPLRKSYPEINLGFMMKLLEESETGELEKLSISTLSRRRDPPMKFKVCVLRSILSFNFYLELFVRIVLHLLYESCFFYIERNTSSSK